jgi:hypothetical protein
MVNNVEWIREIFKIVRILLPRMVIGGNGTGDQLPN